MFGVLGKVGISALFTHGNGFDKLCVFVAYSNGIVAFVSGTDANALMCMIIPSSITPPQHPSLKSRGIKHLWHAYKAMGLLTFGETACGHKNLRCVLSVIIERKHAHRRCKLRALHRDSTELQ